MKITSYQELLKTEAEFNSLLKKHNIPITDQDRIHNVYKLISDFDKIRNNSTARNRFLSLYRRKGAILFALFDLTLISYIIPFISRDNHSIIKRKLKDILRASAPSDESLENNTARNILFELLFFSYLKSVGMSAELREPNPDIFVRIGKRNYFIQCKRVFSLDGKAIRSNVLDAVRQLDIDLKGQGDNSRGIIALSVERMFTQGDRILDVLTESYALEELNKNLRHIADKCGQFWQDPTNVRDKRFVAVFLHHLAITNIREQNLPATGHFILANNTIFPPTQEFIQFASDFNPLYAIMDSIP